MANKHIIAYRIPKDSVNISIRGRIYSYGAFNSQRMTGYNYLHHAYLRSFLRRKHARKFAKR